MRTLHRIALLTGAAAIALGGLTATAAAEPTTASGGDVVVQAIKRGEYHTRTECEIRGQAGIDYGLWTRYTCHHVTGAARPYWLFTD